MNKILSVVFLCIAIPSGALFADIEEGVAEEISLSGSPLLKSFGREIPKTTEEDCGYSPNQIIASTEMTDIQPSDYVETMTESEVTSILEDNLIQVELQLDLEDEIAHQAAKVLQDQKAEEENFVETRPILEDLAELVDHPVSTVVDSPDQANEFLYNALLITQEEKYKIGQILIIMAENSVFKLLFERKKLERLGHDIGHIHPFRFLGTVFSDPRLVHCMRRIRRSGFKWDGFIDGFSQKLKEEVREKNVNQYVASFAEFLDVKAEDIQVFVNHLDFEGLVLYLMEKSRP